jgi:hypothetical protein
MHTIKESAHTLIDQLPDQANWDDVIYAFYVRQKLERSLKAAEAGQVTSHEEAKKRFLNNAN